MAPPFPLFGPPLIHRSTAAGVIIQLPPSSFPSPVRTLTLDFFFSHPNHPKYSTRGLLQKSFDHDPLTTLKLIFSLRRRGATDDAFFAAIVWLHQHHPQTLACNVKAFAKLRGFKDLLEILHRLLQSGQKEDGSKTVKEKVHPTIAVAKRAVERYNCDSKYPFLV